MANYTKKSVINYINKLMGKDYIALDANLNICANYADEDFRGKVLVCNKNIDKVYWFEYLFHYDYCTECKKDLRRNITKKQQEILDNWDAIVAKTYVSSTILTKEKKKKAAEKKSMLEAKRLADCKTFNADFFNPLEGNYLDAIDEIGKRLQNGEYSNLLLNDKVLIEFRTKNKRKDLPFTTNVCGIRTFTCDSKYGDLWEDIDDNMEVYILNSLVGAPFNKKTYDFEQIYNNLEWLEMYAKKKKEKYSDDENIKKASNMLINSIKGYKEGAVFYETELPWCDKKFIIETLLNAHF